MERAEFVNDLCCNYLAVLYGGEEHDFALRMIMENVTDVFLPVELRRLDEENYLYYNISGLQNMEVLYAEKTIDRKAFQAFMWQLHETIEQSRELFLSGDGICLEPSFLFWNMRKKRWEFVYIPGRDKGESADIQGERERLAEFFVMRIDYDDKNLTETVYRFYEEICSGKIDPAYFEMKQMDGTEAIGGTEEEEKGIEEVDITNNDVEIQSMENRGINSHNVKISETYRPKTQEPETDGQEMNEPDSEESGRKRKTEKAGESRGIRIVLCVLCGMAVFVTLSAGRMAPDIILPGGAVTVLLASILFYIHKKQKNIYGNKKAETEDIIYMEQEENSYEIKIAEAEEGEQQIEETVYMDIRQEQERKLYGIGKFRKQKIFLDRLPCLVGKDESLVDHIISDTSVSRMHARFFEEERMLWVQDLNSKNGTYHNGLRLRPNEKIMLEPEDEIGFGRVQFVFR